MEFVETPSFWCPHVGQAACTNFSLQTVELRPLESREIFPFHFFLSPFPFFTSLRTVFTFSLLFSFLLFLLFFFPLLASYLIFPSHFLIFYFDISPFWSTPLIGSKEAISSPISSCHLCGPHFSFFFFYYLFLFYDITLPCGSL